MTADYQRDIKNAIDMKNAEVDMWVASVESVKQQLAVSQETVRRLEAALNTPEILDFAKAVNIEAAHQRERWGTDHDGGKADADWFWLVGYLVGKALHLPEKRLHHLITAAAALANWHLYTVGKTNMRPGIEPPNDSDREARITELESALSRLGDWRLDKAIKHVEALREFASGKDQQDFIDRFHGWLMMVQKILEEAKVKRVVK